MAEDAVVPKRGTKFTDDIRGVPDDTYPQINAVARQKFDPESFAELLKNHGTLGPYIKGNHAEHMCVDGWINFSDLCEELNARLTEAYQAGSADMRNLAAELVETGKFCTPQCACPDLAAAIRSLPGSPKEDLNVSSMRESRSPDRVMEAGQSHSQTRGLSKAAVLARLKDQFGSTPPDEWSLEDWADLICEIGSPKEEK